MTTVFLKPDPCPNFLAMREIKEQPGQGPAAQKQKENPLWESLSSLLCFSSAPCWLLVLDPSVIAPGPGFTSQWISSASISDELPNQLAPTYCIQAPHSLGVVGKIARDRAKV